MKYVLALNQLNASIKSNIYYYEIEYILEL